MKKEKITKKTSTEKKTVEKKSAESVSINKKLKKKSFFIIGIIGIFIIALMIGILALNRKEDKKEPTQETMKETYKVTFDSDGGTIVEEQLIVEGNTVNEPTAPTKENYIFVEWQLDGKNYDFSSLVESNIVLVATWKELKQEQETVKVTFDSNGGSKVASKTIIKGEKVTKPSNPTRDGYTFSKWTLNGKTYNFSKTVSSNITLKATWKKIETETKPESTPEVKPETIPETKPEPTPEVKPETKYTVSFDSNGGTIVSSQTVVEGQPVTKPTEPTKKGYTFSGWKLNGNTYDFGSAVTGNITLVASWKQNSYTIKATAVDSQSPARILSVYENGTKINVQSIKYSDGTLLCSGNNMNVNVYALDDTSYIVILSDGTEVTANLI